MEQQFIENNVLIDGLADEFAQLEPDYLAAKDQM